MQKLRIKLRPLACGGVTLGVLQAFQGVDFNQIWFQFMAQLWSLFMGAIVTVFFGGDPSSLTNLASGSQYGSYFL